jgi:hypothetical protein
MCLDSSIKYTTKLNFGVNDRRSFSMMVISSILSPWIYILLMNFIVHFIVSGHLSHVHLKQFKLCLKCLMLLSPYSTCFLVLIFHQIINIFRGFFITNGF